MKQTLFILGLFLIFRACSSGNSTVESNLDNNEITDIIKTYPDTILTARNLNDKEFQLDLTTYKIDFDKTELLFGEWKTIEGKLKFLNTTIEVGDKVIFKDTISKIMTGWGILVYNRAAKFYFTESGSHQYDYFIDYKGLLNLAQLEYRNEDFSFKEQPEPLFEKLAIRWISDNQIELANNNEIVKLKK